MRDDDDDYQPRAPTQTSPWAVISLIGGVGSLGGTLTACCCPLGYLSIFPAVLAIVIGHVALSQINSSDGNIGGKEMAWIGLGTAYPTVLLNLAMIAFFVVFLVFSEQNKWAAPPMPAPVQQVAGPEQDALSQVQIKILGQGQPAAQGNSPQAIELAKQFNETLTKRWDEAFAEQGRDVPNEGQFVAWCELKPGTCALCVYVPGFSNPPQIDQQLLAALAWEVAKQVTAQTLDEGDELALGLRGELNWGQIFTGIVDEDGKVVDVDIEGDEQSLRPFFEEEAELNLRPDLDQMDDAPAAPNANAKPVEPEIEVPAQGGR